MHTVDCHFIKRALTGQSNECGDTGIIKVHGNQCFMALVDALGHGKEAHNAAVLAENYLLDHVDQDLVAIMQGLHAHLEGSRGAVAAVCRLQLDSGTLRYSGMGNISLKRYGTRPKRLVTKDGILGYKISSPTDNRIDLFPGDIFIMTSDGIREHFDDNEFPDLLLGNARTIAAKFMEKLGKQNDDASCITLRYGI